MAELAGDGSAEGAGGRVVPGADGQTLDIRVPMEFKTRSGRKEIISVRSPSGLPPGAATTADVGPRSSLVVALARAYRWQRMIDSGEVPGVEAIAAQYGVDRAYVSRILNLAMLAPDIVETIIKGKEQSALSLRKLAHHIPERWDHQQAVLHCRVPQRLRSPAELAGRRR